MSNKDDTGAIIKDFLCLWQKQFSYMTKDPETVASMLRLFQQSQDSFFNATKKEDNAESGSASNVSGDVGDELCKLSNRITGLEKRLSQLESKSGKAGQGNPKKAKKKKARRPDTRTSKSVK